MIRLKTLASLMMAGSLLLTAGCSEPTTATDKPVAAAGASAHSEFVEGRDYEVIREQATATAQIKEYFSLFCVHCYNSEPLIKAMRQSLAEDVNFERAHVAFLPQGKPQLGQLTSLAYATAVLLKVEDKMVDAIFDYHFKEKSWLTSGSDFRNVFIVNGVSGEEFDRVIRSEEAREMAMAMSAARQEDGVRFTPDLLVNGKYRILLPAVMNAAEPTERMDQLVAFLLTNP